LTTVAAMGPAMAAAAVTGHFAGVRQLG
jgi:hypothetical protein